MRILYTTTIGLTMIFFKSFIRKLIDEGNVVDIATNENQHAVDTCFKDWGCRVYSMTWSRKPLSYGNTKAVKALKKLIITNKYDVVHCHTPVAAACTRISCKNLRNKGLKVIYTAHGFHFYKGAPLKNWLLYYPIEKLCSRWTDDLVTINLEDYELARKKMKADRVYYVPGVGIDVEKFSNAVVDRDRKRAEIGIPSDAFLLLSVGELNKNKNHESIIMAVARINARKVHYAIAGCGELKEYLGNLANELGIAEQIHLVGYRPDVAELYKVSDVYVCPSLREGLPVSVLEAMASGLPCVVSDIRGNADLIKNGVGGYVYAHGAANDLDRSIQRLFDHKILKERFSEENKRKAKQYDFNAINTILQNLYMKM